MAIAPAATVAKMPPSMSFEHGAAFGIVYQTSYFALVHREALQPGETYVVDTGHLVAWHADMPYKIRKVTKSLFRSLTSGEVLVAEFTGPGVLLMQTRNLQALAAALEPYLPKGDGGSNSVDFT